MKLSDYLGEHIRTGFSAPDKSGALAGLCDLAAAFSGLPAAPLLEVVLKREALGSTGLGNMVALPHGKTTLVRAPLLVLATSETGVDFDSPDGLPARLFVLILTPIGGGDGEHLKILARLGAMFKSSELVAEILAAGAPDEVLRLIKRRE